jgi:hypothetical protein
MRVRLTLSAAVAITLSISLSLLAQMQRDEVTRSEFQGSILWSGAETSKSGMDLAALNAIYSDMDRDPHHNLKGIVIVRNRRLVSIFFYRQSHASWILFAVLFLSPDIFMLGYLANTSTGAALYNLVHTILAPSTLIAAAILLSKWQLLPLAMIWTAHIGLDRMLGYGLKYPKHFKDTHLQHV